MSGTSATKQYSITNQTTGPAQWMQDEGQSLYNQAQSSIPASFTPYAGERVAGYGPTYDQAQGMIQGLAQNPSQDLGTARTTLDQIRNSSNNDINKTAADYINPYSASVLDPVLRTIGQARSDELLQNNAQATAAGAFGDPQAGIARALTNDKYNTQVSDAANRVYSDAWDKGQAQANTVMSRMMQLPQMYQGLDNAEFNRTTALSRYLTGFAQMDQQQKQQNDNIDYENWQNKNGGYATNRLGVLMQLLNATPHSVTTNGSSTTRSEQPDNSTEQLLGKLGGTALGAVLGGPMGASLGSSLGGSLFGGSAAAAPKTGQFEWPTSYV